VSFAAITRDAVVLTVTIPPKIVSRFEEGGSLRTVSVAIGGQAIVTEVPQTVESRKLHLAWEVMSGADVAIVEQLLAGSGPVTVLTHAAATPATCMFGPKSEQKITPFLRAGQSFPEAYPETLADGSAQLAARTQCSVELTLYRI
jgi:hypothetical protein